MQYDGYLAAFPPGTVLNNYGGECVSNIANYLDFNGLHGSIAYANAKDWANNPAMQSEFTWIQNNPTDYNQIPKRGDIIVWNGSLPGSGGYGHIAIWDRKVSPGIFSSYDNNWGGRYLHFVTHNYDYIVGWWARKVSAPAQGDEMINTKEEAQVLYMLLRPNGGGSADEINGTVGHRTFLKFLQDAGPEISVRDQSLKQQAEQVANQTNIINQLNQTVTDITSQNSATKADKDAALVKIADLTAQLTAETDKLKDAQKALDDLKNQAVPTDDSAAQVVADKANPIVKFLTLVINKLRGKK